MRNKFHISVKISIKVRTFLCIFVLLLPVWVDVTIDDQGKVILIDI